MSKDTGHSIRHDREGKFERECAFCGVVFRTNNPNTRYCTFRHKQKANNKAFYKRHKKVIILAVVNRRLKAKIGVRAKAKIVKRSKSEPLEGMSNEDIIAYIQANPEKVRVRK